MKNLMVGLKKFFANKNTVTIIGVVIGVVILYVGYNFRVKQAVTPVKVPYAKVEIASRTKITEDMVGYTEVPQSMVSSNNNLISNGALVVGQYVSYGNTIPANSLFYQEAIMSEEELPDSAFADIKDGYTVYSLSVNMHTTYGNSIYPGNTIDLFLKAVDDDGKIIFGKFIEKIEVMAVKDSSGQHVFESTVESRTPSELLFAVPDDMFELLRKSEYISGNSIEIVPVPRNANYIAEEGETNVASEYIRSFVESKSAEIPENSANYNPTPQVNDDENTVTE